MFSKCLVVVILGVGLASSAGHVAAADNRVWSTTGTVYDRGARATFVAQTFVAGTDVDFTMFSRRPIELGSATADARGVARRTVRLPRAAEEGLYGIRASGLGAQGAQNLDFAITIRPAPPAWRVTSQQYRSYAVTVALVAAFAAAAVVQRRRRKASAARFDA